MKRKIAVAAVLIILCLAIGGILLWKMKREAPEEYYGRSTYGSCQTDDDCYVSGCNAEVCQSTAEEPIMSICVVPDKPTPNQLGYRCRCVEQKCQWAK